MPAQAAFSLFTEHIGAWWPLADKNVLGQGSRLAFEDGILIERNGDATAAWAEVTEWAAPACVRLAFHPGHEPAESTDLLVSFTAAHDTTRVELEHRDWHRIGGTGPAARAAVTQGWDDVLNAYRQQAGDTLSPHPG